jgi:ATP-dependent helicase/DNAse subunit B
VKEFGGDSDALMPTLMNAFHLIWRTSHIGPDGHRIPAFSMKFAVALQRAAVERRATEILTRYLRTEAEQAKDRRIIGCEKKSDFSVRGYPFVAKMDRIDLSTAGHIIIDYKTSSSGPKTPRSIKKKFLNVDGDPKYEPEDFQLPLYLLAGRNEGYRPGGLSYYWLGQEDSSGSFKKSLLRVCDDEPDCLSAEEMNEVETNIIAVVEQIAAGDFRAHPKSSFECTWCSFGHVCDAEQQDEPTDDQ